MIVLLGMAGAGKSYQGRLMADEYGFAWISTGEILRVLITGARRQEMLAGKLLSDKEVINVMDKVLELIDSEQEFVLDGFPRTAVQANWLMEQITSGRFNLTAVFNLQADEEIVRNRLLQRGRQDDTNSSIAERFKEYQETTLPILEHFKQAGVNVIDIDASKAPEIVHHKIIATVEKVHDNVHPG